MKDLVLAAVTLSVFGGCVYLFIIKVAEYAAIIQ